MYSLGFPELCCGKHITAVRLAQSVGALDCNARCHQFNPQGLTNTQGLKMQMARPS